MEAVDIRRFAQMVTHVDEDVECLPALRFRGLLAHAGLGHILSSVRAVKTMDSPVGSIRSAGFEGFPLRWGGVREDHPSIRDVGSFLIECGARAIDLDVSPCCCPTGAYLRNGLSAAGLRRWTL